MSGLAESSTAAERPRLSPELKRVAILLAVSIFINYIDRGTLSMAAPLIKRDQGLSDIQLGILFSAFFWTYASFQIVSGWLVDRLSVNRLLAGGVAVWSVATLATGFLGGFAWLLAMRLLLGIGESVAYPSYSKIIANHFPESGRGRANSFITAGYACGPAFGTLAGGLLMARVGWRIFFIVLGLASLLWLVPWTKWSPKATAEAALRRLRPATIRELLAQHSVWGTFLGLFSYNYLSYLLITWLPSFLVRERHFSLQTMAVIGGLAFFGLGVSATLSGWLSDRWIAAGGSVTRVRKTFAATGMALASSIALVPVFDRPQIAVAILIFACMSAGACSGNLWAMTQTMAGPETAGRWTGLQNFVGNMAGVIAPALTGIILARTGQFLWAFIFAGIVCLIGSLTWIFFVGRIEPISWPSHNRQA